MSHRNDSEVFQLKDFDSPEAFNKFLRARKPAWLTEEHIFTNVAGFYNKQFLYRHIFEPPCECEECKQQYREKSQQELFQDWAYGSVVTAEGAQREIAKFLKSTRANLQYIREQTNLHGNTIYRRWKKYSRDRRAAKILGADPNIYPTEWCHAQWSVALNSKLDPDNLNPYDTVGREGRPYRNAALLPYVNLEFLCGDPARLLSLLYHRVVHDPKEWVVFDNRMLNEAWGWGLVETQYSRQSIIMAGAKFGSLVDFSAEHNHRWTYVGYARAILVLEAQDTLYRFLRGVVGEIVFDLSNTGSEPQCDLFMNLQLGMKMSSSLERASPFLNEPLSPPPVFDLLEMIEIAESRLEMHNDHLIALQIDPSYLTSYVSLITAGEYEASVPHRKKLLIAPGRLMQDSVDFWSWEWIIEALQQVLNLSKKSFKTADQTVPLAPSLENAIGSLECLMMEIIKNKSEYLRFTIPARPGFYQKYNFSWAMNDDLVVVMERKEDTRMDITRLFTTDRLDHVVTKIASLPTYLDPKTPVRRHEYNPEGYFAMLDAHIVKCKKENNRKELSRLDDILDRAISDLSAMYQLLGKLQTIRPHLKKRTSEDIKPEEYGKGWRYIKSDFLEQGMMYDCENEKYQFREDREVRARSQAILATTLSVFLQQPKPKGRLDQKWIHVDIKQRSALDLLWQHMGAMHHELATRLKIRKADIDSDLELFTARHDPRHVESLKLQREQIMKRNEDTKKKVDVSDYTPQSQWGSESTEQKRIQTQKAKVKNQREERPVESPLANDQAPVIRPIPPPQQITATVSRKSFSILRSLFHCPDDEVVKTVSWQEFVAAMADGEVGFRATQNHGSEVSFNPGSGSKWLGKGRIVIHKPHDEVLTVVKLRGIGHRMGKHFGWNNETFVVTKGKEKK